MSSLEFPIRGDLLSVRVATRNHVAHVESAFQTIDIWETDVFGKILLLDGHVQLSEFDEKAYHECLVRLPMLNLPNAKSALVVGGGDGGAIRELCRFPGLESIEIAEIDLAVIETCKTHLPTLSAGAFDDPRVKVHVGDALAYVRERREKYDLIILDSTDTYEESSGELSEALFTQAFYEDCFKALRPGGLVVTQADNPVFCPYSVAAIKEQLGSVFGPTGTYVGLVPSFGGFSAFCFAGRDATLAQAWDPAWQSGAYLTEAIYNLAFSELNFGG
jgi:spermidine synthase